MFKNRSFAVSSVGSIVLGAGMFGGILLLPQYLQIVHGSSPTVAGLQMIPLVAGIMTGAMGSGIAISKTGKYKIYPLVGIVFIVAALVSMSFIIDADTSVWSLAPFMVLLGVGLGFNFQPVILAVQNAVSAAGDGRRDVVGHVLPPDGRHDRGRGLPVDPVHHAAGQDRQRADLGRGHRPAGRPALSERPAAGWRDLSDTSFIQKLPDFLATPFKTGFSDSIDLVFLVAAAVVAIGFFVMLFLPELPLRDKSGIQALQDDGSRHRGTSAASRPPAVAGIRRRRRRPAGGHGGGTRAADAGRSRTVRIGAKARPG